MNPWIRRMKAAVGQEGEAMTKQVGKMKTCPFCGAIPKRVDADNWSVEHTELYGQRCVLHSLKLITSRMWTRWDRRTPAEQPICLYCNKPVEANYCHVECREKRLAHTEDGGEKVRWIAKMARIMKKLTLGLFDSPFSHHLVYGAASPQIDKREKKCTCNLVCPVHSPQAGAPKPTAQEDEGERTEHQSQVEHALLMETERWKTLYKHSESELASLQAEFAEYEEHTGTLGRSLSLLKENNQLKDKLAEKEKSFKEACDNLHHESDAVSECVVEMAEKDKELADYKDATNISPAVIEKWTKENAEDKKRIKELEAEAKQRSNEEARDIRREVEYDNGMRQRPCCAKAEAKLKATKAVVEAAINDEPECPGDMPREMLERISKDRDALIEAFRITVRLTKKNILARYKANLDKPKEEPEEKHYLEEGS